TSPAGTWGPRGGRWMRSCPPPGREPLAAESLATVLAVHLIRNVLEPRQPAGRRHGTLPRAKLRAVVEYIEEPLDASPTLEQMAALARLSPYYFARSVQAAHRTPAAPLRHHPHRRL